MSNKINIEELQRLYDIELSESVRIKVELLITAVNDWPNPIYYLDEFAAAVTKFVEGEATKDNIVKALQEIDFSTDAWVAESLSSVINLYDYYSSGTTFKDIVEDINAIAAFIKQEE